MLSHIELGIGQCVGRFYKLCTPWGKSLGTYSLAVGLYGRAGDIKSSFLAQQQLGVFSTNSYRTGGSVTTIIYSVAYCPIRGTKACS